MSRAVSHQKRSPLRAGACLGPNRAANEYYPTPPEATRALLAKETFSGSIWEPACGEGWISKELSTAGYDVVSTDIADYGYGEAGVDFLEARSPRARNIVTNPPYGRGLADMFVRRALHFIAGTGGRVAMLLNIASLCHPDRYGSFIRRPPSVVYALDQCVCYPNGRPEQATRHTLAHRYCWMIWDAEPTTETILRWLSTANHGDVEQGGSSHADL